MATPQQAHSMSAPSQAAAMPDTNMGWLFSEPLLDAALAQISTLEQFATLQESYNQAEAQGKEVPDRIRDKLTRKQAMLWGKLVEEHTRNYLESSGLAPLVQAKLKWDDVHFMAEAHGVGSSIPMVGYTGLSQGDLEKGMNSFYQYLAANPLTEATIKDASLRNQVASNIGKAYQELHEYATGEFGGYEPFQTMVDHPPEKVKEVLMPNN